MAAVTRLGLYGGPRPPYAEFQAQVTAAITGTVIGAGEADIVAGGRTIIITLTADTWGATVGDDNAITTALINGIDSAGSEANGWDAVVKAGLTHADVTRDSPTVVTVLLPAFASYDITADETITVTVPNTALVTSSEDVTGTPTFDITAIALRRGGGVSRRRRRRFQPYPRRVLLGDVRVWVYSAEEERYRLEQYRAQLERRYDEMPATAEPERRRMRRRIKQLSTRIERSYDRADDFAAMIEQEDEELIVLLM